MAQILIVDDTAEMCTMLRRLFRQSGNATDMAQVASPVYYVTVERGLTSPATGMIRRAVREAEAAGATAFACTCRTARSSTAPM